MSRLRKFMPISASVLFKYQLGRTSCKSSHHHGIAVCSGFIFRRYLVVISTNIFANIRFAQYLQGNVGTVPPNQLSSHQSKHYSLRYGTTRKITPSLRKRWFGRRWSCILPEHLFVGLNKIPVHSCALLLCVFRYCSALFPHRCYSQSFCKI
jgi:hypothetical protein